VKCGKVGELQFMGQRLIQPCSAAAPSARRGYGSISAPRRCAAAVRPRRG
jgi:hypothetical protein